MNVIRSFQQACHWYYPSGKGCHTVPSGNGAPRPATIRDARKLGLLPSVTKVTGMLRAPALENWKMEQAILAAMTTPRLVAEADDAFVERVLNIERQHESEAESARRLGTDIHAAIQGMLNNQQVPDELRAYCEAARRELNQLEDFNNFDLNRCETEVVVVGEGYAGRLDLRIWQPEYVLIIDFKTCKNIPEKAYDEHLLQLGAYCGASKGAEKLIWKAANIFVSTTEPGKAATIHHDNVKMAYRAFKCLLSAWMWQNDYYPEGCYHEK